LLLDLEPGKGVQRLPPAWAILRSKSLSAIRTRCILARRLDWASLLERVFGPDVTECPRCRDRLRVLAFITDPDATTRILAHLGLPAATPTVAPARAPPETSFDVTA
jgi:hypothetical protein